MNFTFESKENLILCTYRSNGRDYIGHAVFNSDDNEEKYSVEIGKQISKLRALKNHQEFEIYVFKQSIAHLVTSYSSLTNSEILITTDEILKYDFEDSKDIDILELVENPTGFKYQRQFRFKDKCVFQWKRMTPEEFIEVTLQNNTPMEIGKFLVPDFIKEIGITIDHLKQLSFLIERLDDHHKYEKVIYDSYIANNDFTLTDEQLNDAYKMYLKYR